MGEFPILIVRDGIHYALALAGGGALVWYLASPWFARPLFVLAAFCLYFFSDRTGRSRRGPVAVSPADGKVVAVKPEGDAGQRLSIFLKSLTCTLTALRSAGVITDVKYQPGKFLVASREECSLQNEQNV